MRRANTVRDGRTGACLPMAVLGQLECSPQIESRWIGDMFKVLVGKALEREVQHPDMQDSRVVLHKSDIYRQVAIGSLWWAGGEC
ncbi:hypothetical protein DMY87_04285 [Rhizobium wuzhouense]|uniref:Uncharacterized protein n=1 Tax=Rhizobium wuzhouense TaxID=1986026 RepID=A0ABX5P190_9HYPH|nr:hypothetical protein DMY87_04285 [Rhizobium wuzhouense]